MELRRGIVPPATPAIRERSGIGRCSNFTRGRAAARALARALERALARAGSGGSRRNVTSHEKRDTHSYQYQYRDHFRIGFEQRVRCASLCSLVQGGLCTSGSLLGRDGQESVQFDIRALGISREHMS